MLANIVVGTLSQTIINLLALTSPAGSVICISPGNTAHMQKKHHAAYIIYGNDIQNIISSPDYVGINAKDGSIEYIKQNPANGDFVKVAVRETNRGVLFVRSLYILNARRVSNFIENGQLKPIPPALDKAHPNGA